MSESIATSPTPLQKGSRLKFEDRKRLILEAAAELFAERGFDLSTPDLARRMNVTQSLLYRYYDDKQQLLRAAFHHVSPDDAFYEEQIRQLCDRSLSLRLRLMRFYLAYSEITWSYLRVRIHMWVNLLEPEWNLPYYNRLQDIIYPTIGRELRAAFAPDGDEEPQDSDLELARSLHGAMYHMAAIRRWLHPEQNRRPDIMRSVDLLTTVFLDGAASTYQPQQ
jgi:AcrR family transcriptional regulator